MPLGTVAILSVFVFVSVNAPLAGMVINEKKYKIIC